MATLRVTADKSGDLTIHGPMMESGRHEGLDPKNLSGRARNPLLYLPKSVEILILYKIDNY